jgi:hypothetical protein
MNIIDILNVEENKKNINPKSYNIKYVDNQGEEFETVNPKIYCLRMWLNCEFPLELKNDYMEFEFKNKTKNILLSGKVVEKGFDNNRHFVVIFLNRYTVENKPINYILEDNLNGDWEYKIEEFKEIFGNFEVNVVFSPEMIINGQKLYKSLGNIWPSFHDSEFSILEYSAKKIALRFYDALPENRILDVILKDIISEDYGRNTLEFFTKRPISSISFLKKDDYIELVIFHDDSSINYEEGDYKLENPKIQKAEYYGYIKSKSVKVSFEDNNGN